METVEAAAVRPRFTGLWRHPDFVKLWVGQTISELGSRITRDGLPLVAVLVLGATPAEMGLLAAISSALVLLVGLPAGVWVDRLRRRPILIAADIGRTFVLMSIPIAAVLGRLSMAQLYVVAASIGVLTVFFDTAYEAYLPSLVERQHLAEGNSKLALSRSAAEVVGSGAAGMLVQALTAPIAIFFDSISFLFSIGSLALIRKPEPLPMPARAGQRWRAVREMVDGLHFVLHDSRLRALALSDGTRAFFGNFIGVLYALYAIRELGLGAAALGVTIAMGGVGSLVGSVLAERSARRFGLGATLIGTMTLGSGATCLILLAGGLLWVAITILIAAQLIGDALYTIFEINAISLRQAITPDRLLGRTNASFRLLVMGVGPMGALVGGVLGEAIGVRATLLLAAAGTLSAAGWLMLSPIRRLTQPPVAVENDTGV